MKYSVSLVYLLLVFSCFGQGDTLSELEKNRLQLGYRIEYSDEPIEDSSVKRILQEGLMVNGRKEGVWIKYWDNSNMKLKGFYKGNRPAGNYEKYYKNGILKESGTFNRNKFYGELKRYFESGCPQYEARYNDNGNEHGSVTYYFDGCESAVYPEGHIEFQFNVVDGISVDSAFRYYENEDLKELIVYKADGTIKSSKQFDRVNPQIKKSVSLPNSEGSSNAERLAPECVKVNSSAQKIYIGTCKDDRIWTGTRYFYDTTGNWFKVEIWEEGRFVKSGYSDE
jgi:antitoxin component YwqK of YwqJK toxin-antitoxin module